MFDNEGKLEGYYKEVKTNVFVFTDDVFPTIKEYNAKNGLPCDILYNIKDFLLECKCDFCTLFIPNRGLTYWFYPIVCYDDSWLHVPMIAYRISLLNGMVLEDEYKDFSFVEPYRRFSQGILRMFGYITYRYVKKDFEKGEHPLLLITCRNESLSYKVHLLAFVEERDLELNSDISNLFAYKNYQTNKVQKEKEEDEEFYRNPYKIPFYLVKSNVALGFDYLYSVHYIDTDHPVIVFRFRGHYLKAYDFKRICEVVMNGNVDFVLEHVKVRDMIVDIASWIYGYYKRKGIELQKTKFRALCQSFGKKTFDRHKSSDESLLGVSEFLTYIVSAVSRFNLKIK